MRRHLFLIDAFFSAFLEKRGTNDYLDAYGKRFVFLLTEEAMMRYILVIVECEKEA